MKKLQILLMCCLVVGFAACDDDKNIDKGVYNDIDFGDVNVKVGELKDTGTQLIWAEQFEDDDCGQVTIISTADYEGDKITALKEVWVFSDTNFAKTFENGTEFLEIEKVSRDGNKVMLVYKKSAIIYNSASAIRIIYGSGGSSTSGGDNSGSNGDGSGSQSTSGGDDSGSNGDGSGSQSTSGGDNSGSNGDGSGSQSTSGGDDSGGNGNGSSISLGGGNSSGNGNVPAVTTGVENGYEWVDLGLTSGTKWATANVGASKPEEYGNYYAWGEVTPKEIYNWETYKYGSQYGMYKYSTYYTISGYRQYNVLELSDDAAAVNWGGKWRMPTEAQLDELREQCYLLWTDSYNNSTVAGYIVYKAKSESDKGVKIYEGETPSSSYSLSDAHIFLPAAGRRVDGGLKDAGSYGHYWSSEVKGSNATGAESLFFYSSDVEDCGGCAEYSRYIGFSVRAVFK